MYVKESQRNELGFLPVIIAAATQAASAYSAKVQGKAQSKVLNAQTALENVRARSAEIASRNRILLFGVGGAVALGALVFALRRK